MLHQPTKRHSSSWDRAAAVLVWGVWLVTLLGALALVGRYGSNVPTWDDWDIVPTMTGEQPVTLEWLWSQHNEHRVPLPRLLMLGVVRFTVQDLRALMAFNVMIMGAIAGGAIIVARRIQGRTSLTDAFFPLALLHWGHAVNFLWGWQLQFFSSAALATLALLALVSIDAGRRPRTAGLVVGTVVLLLPLCGGQGLALAPALALWLVYSAWLAVKAGTAADRRDRALLAGLAFAAFLLCGLYFVGWQPVPWHPKSPGLVWTLTTATQVLTLGLGPAARLVWPGSGCATLLLLALTALLVTTVWWRKPGERRRATGLLLFLGAMVTLALAVGLSRSGFETRYVSLFVPVWCGLYLVWTLYGPPPFRSPVRTVLLLAATVAFWPNTRHGLAWAEEVRGHLAAFERDMASGVARHELVRRYAPYLHVHQDVPTEYLPMLRRAEIGRYALLRDGPSFREVRVPLEPSGLHLVDWTGKSARVTGPGAWIDFALSRDDVVAGIRLRYQYRDREGTLPFVRVAWRASHQPDLTEEWLYATSQHRKYSPTGDRATWERGTWTRRHDTATTMTAWVSGPVGQIRVMPNVGPGTFEITELTLLLAGR